MNLRSRANFMARLFSFVLLISALSSGMLVFATLQSLTDVVLTGRGSPIGFPVDFGLDSTSYELSAGASYTGVPLSFAGSSASIILFANPPFRGLWFLTVFIDGIFTVFYLYVMFRLWKMFNGFADGNPFEMMHVRTLKLVGGLFIAAYGLQKVRVLLSRYIWTLVEASGVVAVPELRLQYLTDYSNYLFGLLLSDVSFLFAGIGVWLVAEVFSYAAGLQNERDTLQREQDLTI